MHIQIPEPLRMLAEQLKSEGVRLYAVGGLVRNRLLQLPQSDIDVCGALPPDALLSACGKAGISCTPKAAEMGSLLLHFDGETMEYTTFRREAYNDGGAHRPDTVGFGVSMEEDAFRRDFTINALYADALTGEVTDPTGGLADLKAGVIRATHPNADEIMGADALRVLRMVRFQGELGFRIDAQTLAAAQRHAHLLKDIAPERRMQEFSKILLCDAKYKKPEAAKDGATPVYESQALLSALHLLDELGAMALIVPRLMDGRGMAQRSDYHRYDVLEHAFRVCQNTPPVLTLRFAGLLHDIGKPESFTMQGDLHAHERMGAVLAEEALEQLRAPKRLKQQVQWLVGNHMYDLNGRTKEKTLRRRFVLWGEETTKQLICLREADVRGSGMDTAYVFTKWRTLLTKMQLEGVPFTESALAVTGADIIAATGLKPGHAIGFLKRKLFLHTAVHPRDNTREKLLAVLAGMAYPNKRQAAASAAAGAANQRQRGGQKPCQSTKYSENGADFSDIL